ncbi:hypothetical protein F4778DRAFT_716774, partial [Xylariomycetidae sp. FL2044]
MSTSKGSPPLVRGSCLCQAVKYELAGGHGTKLICHCLTCKKITGSAFIAVSFTERKVFDPRESPWLFQSTSKVVEIIIAPREFVAC